MKRKLNLLINPGQNTKIANEIMVIIIIIIIHKTHTISFSYYISHPLIRFWSTWKDAVEDTGQAIR